jgi:hypothetical protein
MLWLPEAVPATVTYSCDGGCSPDEIQHALDRLVPASDDPAPDWAGRKALALDFDKEPELPEYLVDRLIERQVVAVLSGDTGAAKSIVASDLLVAAIQERDWLGRNVEARRVLALDEENPERLVRARLRALGAKNEVRQRLRYFSRLGTRLGADDWLDWLRHETQSHGADLLTVDTAMAATAAEVNDNDSVVRLYSGLRQLATDLNVAVLLLHHERKQQPGQTRDPGQAMLGARQWAGQADTHLTLRVASPMTDEPTAEGHRRLRREFTLRMPKVRDGEPDVAETVAVTSEKDHANRLLWMRVASEGAVEPAEDRATSLSKEMSELLTEFGEMRTGQLAAKLGMESKDGTFTRARDKALAEGRIVLVKYGVYGAPGERHEA